MGLYDRDYYQDDQPSGMFARGDQVMMVTKLVILTVGLFLADMLVGGRDHWLTNWMSVRAQTLVNPQYWWQFLSYGFAHSYRDVWHIIGNMLVLWILGREVELKYGRAEFLRIYLVALVLGSLFWTTRSYLTLPDDALEAPFLRSPSLLGASGAVTCVVILYAINFPKRTLLFMFLFPMPAWVLGVLVVGSDLLRMRGDNGSNVAFDVHLVGAAFAGLYWYLGLNFRRLVPSRFSMKSLKPRPRLKIHDPAQRTQQLDQQADRILDKLHQEGEQALTSKERRILEEYSRRMRQKHS